MPALIQKIITLFMTLLALLGIGNNAANPPAQQADSVASCSVSKKSVLFTFVSNPSTGYGWSYTQTGDSVSMTKEEYKSGDMGNTAGAPGKQLYTFTAEKQGKTTVTFVYERPWENVTPLYTYVAVISVDEDLKVSLDSFTKI